MGHPLSSNFSAGYVQQVARILRRSLDEGRAYEDVSVKQILEPKRSEIDATNVPVTRVESEKVTRSKSNRTCAGAGRPY